MDIHSTGFEGQIVRHTPTHFDPPESLLSAVHAHYSIGEGVTEFVSLQGTQRRCDRETCMYFQLYI